MRGKSPWLLSFSPAWCQPAALAAPRMCTAAASPARIIPGTGHLCNGTSLARDIPGMGNPWQWTSPAWDIPGTGHPWHRASPSQDISDVGLPCSWCPALLLLPTALPRRGGHTHQQGLASPCSGCTAPSTGEPACWTFALRRPQELNKVTRRRKTTVR